MKFKTLALAASLLAAAPAFAEIALAQRQVGPVGTAELFLVVSDGQNHSFTYDTGVTFDQLLAGALSGQQTLLNQVVSGAQWTAFVNAKGGDLSGGTAQSGVRFAMGMYDGYGTPEDNRHIIVTRNTSLAAFNFDNGTLNDMFYPLAASVFEANSTGTHPDVYEEDADGVQMPITDNNGQSYNNTTTSPGAVFTNSSFNLGGFGKNISNPIGTEGVALSVFSGNGNGSTAASDEIGAFAPYTVAFTVTNGVGTLSVTAVPEPSSYALLIAGLAAVGFVARRRAAR